MESFPRMFCGSETFAFFSATIYDGKLTKTANEIQLVFASFIFLFEGKCMLTISNLSQLKLVKLPSPHFFLVFLNGKKRTKGLITRDLLLASQWYFISHNSKLLKQMASVLNFSGNWSSPNSGILYKPDITLTSFFQAACFHSHAFTAAVCLRYCFAGRSWEDVCSVKRPETDLFRGKYEKEEVIAQF